MIFNNSIGLPLPILIIFPIQFLFLIALIILSTASSTYKKSLFCLPCDEINSLFLTHALINKGINLFIFCLVQKLDKI